MSNETYENKHINQAARQDVYKQAKRFIPRAIKEMIRTWGINVTIYQPKTLGIGGHTDSSRVSFSEEPIYVGSAFIPSVIQSQVGRGRTALLDIFDRKTPRMLFDKVVEVPNGSLVVVNDMDRVMNYIVDEVKTAISPNSESVYSSYNLVPYNIIDTEKNKNELESVKEKVSLDIAEFEVDEGYDNTKQPERSQTYTDTDTHSFSNIKVKKNNRGIND